MVCGICVITRNRPLLLGTLLQALQDTTQYSSHTIKIVVGIDRDTVSTPVCVSYGVPYVYAPVAGITANRNAAAHAVKDCDIIILFEDDFLPIKEGWLDRIVEALAGGDIPFLFTLQKRLHHPAITTKQCKNAQIELYALSSAFTIAFPRKTLETIGYWAPEFGERYGFDEAEWGLRAKKAYDWDPDLWPSLPNTEEYFTIIENPPSSDSKSVEERAEETKLNHATWCSLLAKGEIYQPYPY